MKFFWWADSEGVSHMVYKVKQISTRILKAKSVVDKQLKEKKGGKKWRPVPAWAEARCRSRYAQDLLAHRARGQNPDNSRSTSTIREEAKYKHNRASILRLRAIKKNDCANYRHSTTLRPPLVARVKKTMNNLSNQKLYCCKILYEIFIWFKMILPLF